MNLPPKSMDHFLGIPQVLSICQTRHLYFFTCCHERSHNLVFNGFCFKTTPDVVNLPFDIFLEPSGIILFFSLTNPKDLYRYSVKEKHPTIVLFKPCPIFCGRYFIDYTHKRKNLHFTTFKQAG